MKHKYKCWYFDQNEGSPNIVGPTVRDIWKSDLISRHLVLIRPKIDVDLTFFSDNYRGSKETWVDVVSKFV